MRSEIPAIHKTGAELVVVGNGNAYFAKTFRNEHQLTTPLFTDPKRASYQAAGLKYGFWRTLGPKSWGQLMRQLKNRLTKIKGDPWQQGGVFIVMPDGSVPYHHISEVSSDQPLPQDIIGALQTAVKRA